MTGSAHCSVQRAERRVSDGRLGGRIRNRKVGEVPMSGEAAISKKKPPGLALFGIVVHTGYRQRRGACLEGAKPAMIGEGA